MDNFHLIEVRYFGPTDTKGSRVKLVSDRFSHSVTLPYNHSFNSAADLAVDYLQRQGHNVLGVGLVNGNDVVVCGAEAHQFKPLKD